jgi:hypothetical protein
MANNNELRAHYRLVSHTLGQLYRERSVAWAKWMEALPGDLKQAALRNYLGVLGAITEVRYAMREVKREMNHAR